MRVSKRPVFEDSCPKKVEALLSFLQRSNPRKMRVAIKGQVSTLPSERRERRNSNSPMQDQTFLSMTFPFESMLGNRWRTEGKICEPACSPR